MIDPIGAGTVERFRSVVADRLGLRFDDAKLGFLAEVLQRRVEKHQWPCDGYVQALSERPPDGELGALARELTVPETYFFRNNDQFRVLADVVLPERMRIRAQSKTLRFLSAGCASGEEAYSIAIAARNAIADESWKIVIRALDINPAALEKARHGRFSAWALRETPMQIQQQWFRPDNREMILDQTIRDAVTFEERNLADEDPDLGPDAAWDAIYCRNVLMYFTPERASALAAHLAQALAPGGYLFLGHAETLRGLSDAFHLLHTHDTFYYQRKEALSEASSAHARHRPRSIMPAPSAPAPAFSNAWPTFAWPTFAWPTFAWIDTIRQASEQVEALVAAHDPAREPALAAKAGAAKAGWDAGWNRARAMDLLRQERFTEALTTIHDLPSDLERDPDILLLKAMLLAHSQRLIEARETCERLLAIDELNAGAHYVLALCQEGFGDAAGALEQDRVAIYLDPAFAMPRLHAGLLARRAGDRASARRELNHALILLKQEDASRILLFGGGFSREALMAMCETIMRDGGGAR